MAPLILSRAATIYSLTQLVEQEGEGRAICTTDVSAPECPVRQIRTSLIPLYCFPAADGYKTKRIRSFGDLQSLTSVPDIDEMQRNASSDDDAMLFTDGSSDSGSSAAQVVPQRSILDNLMLAEWEDRAEAGLFRYDVTACPTQVVPGSYGFIAQLNEGRASKKRPTEFCVDQVNQPFDDSKFNFCKAMQREVLFQFQPSSPDSTVSLTPCAPVVESPHLVFINVSPIEYGHVLLVPRVLDNLNQLVDSQTFLLALQFAREANNPYFRIGFNTLGAYATINHLHFQAYYLAAPYPLERAPTAPIKRAGATIKLGSIKGDVSVSELVGYPVRGLVFEMGTSLGELAEVVATACQRLTLRNIPHNMMIVDRGARVFLVPNAFAERKAKGELPEDIMDTMVDPAVFEISGHIVLKRQEDYDVCLADQGWTWRLLEFASFSEEKFAQVVDICIGKDV